MLDKITEIFYLVDEFCKEFNKAKEGHVLPGSVSKNKGKKAFSYD